ncbi:hypothetical protein PoB_007076000 [Plakobranchus ocellatus]|uniref:Chitin-binding type-2 domain-containing protein n=1 Tax=Plakobranchus ocellatus TaxID=259542 RepID=A0AAV4DJV1_9GAST|nr:hypothetical protein PoB_007076000 [Plakobranchus ocellatus]
MKCITPGTGQTDCFAPVTCVGKTDASYPDYGDKCTTYYRCQGGLLLGRFYCPTPLGFNEDLGICDYPVNLRAPCGPRPALKTTTAAPPATTPTTTTTTTTASTKQTATVTVQVTMSPSSTTVPRTDISTQSSSSVLNTTGVSGGSAGVGPIIG